MALAYARPVTTGGYKAFGAIVTATSNDTTTTVNSQAIPNTDGSIRRIAFQLACTDKTGTSPTVNVILQGSVDGTNFVNIKDSAGNDISTGATSISSAGGGTTIQAQLDTNMEGITRFYPYVRAQVVVGGSSTPGWTGVVYADVDRPKQGYFLN